MQILQGYVFLLVLTQHMEKILPLDVKEHALQDMHQDLYVWLFARMAPMEKISHALVLAK